MDAFNSIQWRNTSDDEEEPSSHLSASDFPNGEEPQAGRNADKIDIAGVGNGTLETKVSDPQTENEGTKDAFVSYLVTTKVKGRILGLFCGAMADKWTSRCL